MKKQTFIYSSLILLFIAFYLSGSSAPEERKIADSYQIKAIKLPKHIEFAGERVPVEREDIKERVDREFLVNTYWQSNALLLIKRSNKYFPIIEPILEEYGVPDDFKYLAVIESGLTQVTSPAGARGFWQLMKGTARDHKLEVNANVDERYHIEKSTRVACQYLLKQKERFGSWTSAAAAYNVGPNGLDRRMEKQGVESYFDLHLPDETSRYVPRIIAIKYILEDPLNYGFVFDESDLYALPELKTVSLDTAITDLADFSQKMNITYKELKLYNPWLRESKLNNASRKAYDIQIPVAQP